MFNVGLLLGRLLDRLVSTVFCFYARHAYPLLRALPLLNAWLFSFEY
jgi:hypothetical protein